MKQSIYEEEEDYLFILIIKLYDDKTRHLKQWCQVLLDDRFQLPKISHY